MSLSLTCKAGRTPNRRTTEPQIGIGTAYLKNRRTAESHSYRTTELSNGITTDPQNRRSTEPQTHRAQDPQNHKASKRQYFRTHGTISHLGLKQALMIVLIVQSNL